MPEEGLVPDTAFPPDWWISDTSTSLPSADFERRDAQRTFAVYLACTCLLPIVASCETCRNQVPLLSINVFSSFWKGKQFQELHTRNIVVSQRPLFRLQVLAKPQEMCHQARHHQAIQ